MAINDKATMIINVMRFYTAPVGTAAPTAQAYWEDKTTALSAWEEIGHTSLESPFQLTSEGGEVQVKGSLQNHALRTTTSDKTWALELELSQWDKATIKRYLGANAKEVNGLLYAQTKATSEQVALLGVAEDGDRVMFLHGEKVDISASGDVDAGSIEDFVNLPVKFTFLEGENGTVGVSPLLEKSV